MRVNTIMKSFFAGILFLISINGKAQSLNDFEVFKKQFADSCDRVEYIRNVISFPIRVECFPEGTSGVRNYKGDNFDLFYSKLFNDEIVKSFKNRINEWAVIEGKYYAYWHSPSIELLLVFEFKWSDSKFRLSNVWCAGN